jgi:fluoride exporter
VINQPEIRAAIAISLGAIAGALTRYHLSLWFARRLGTAFPYGTFFINLTGCLVMGFFTTLVLERFTTLSPDVRLVVAVGFLGSYTTFSTYGLDTIMLLHSGQIGFAWFYAVGSAVLGIIGVQLGIILARFW